MLQTKNKTLFPVLIFALSLSSVPIMVQELYKNEVVEATFSESEKVADMEKEIIKQATMSDAVQKKPYTGFKWENSTWKYLDEGKALKNSFLVKSGNLYHFDEQGDRTTGWFYDQSGQTYFFDENGISQEGWIQTEDGWKFLSNGVCATGWIRVQDNWYFFNEKELMMADYVTPDGYYVDASGKYIDEAGQTQEGDGFTWNKDRTAGTGIISGLEIAGMPAEFFMLAIAGETSGMSNANALISGDDGRAYGACQFDYRYNLVDFMRFAYQKHPTLWPGFEKYLQYQNGDERLKNNINIGKSFLSAMDADYESCLTDQLEFIRMRYWDPFLKQMQDAGFRLAERPVAVQAAFLSVNVNCGAQADKFIEKMSPDMSDEAMIRTIYEIRNTTLAAQKVRGVKKRSSKRYRHAEPQMALDLLYGYVTIDSHASYGGGVEWHGNPFINQITTIPTETRVIFEREEQEMATSSVATISKLQ